MDALSYKDLCLIIVGPGSRAEAMLARQRLNAGGRLAHILTKGEDDDRVKLVQEPVSGSYMTWQPPRQELGISWFGKKIGAQKPTIWTKNGPDAIELPEDCEMKIMVDPSGVLRHVCIVSAQDDVIMALSGEVVLNPDMDLARAFPVEVRNPDLQPFGCFSTRFVRLAMVSQFVTFVARFLVGNSLEKATDDWSVLWARGFVRTIPWLLFGQTFCVGVWLSSLTGERPNGALFLLAHMIFVVAILACSYLQLSDVVAATAAEIPMLAIVPPVAYWLTMDKYPQRQLLASMKWSISLICGTLGAWFTFTFIGLGYGTLLSTGNGAIAAIFLPVLTAGTEIALVVYARTAYTKLVYQPRLKEGQVVAGDQLAMCGPSVVYAAHALAEACRLAATFSGAVTTGGYVWIATTLLSVILNISARLGWSRFVLVKIATRLWGGPTAMKIFAPTAWSKLHDELKIYCGYFRFATVCALVAGRAIEYGLIWEGPRATFFNTSAMCVLIFGLILEKIEDVIVVHELLPVNPAGPGLLKFYAAGHNSDAKQLVALEAVEMPDATDPWRMSELSQAGRRKSEFVTAKEANEANEQTLTVEFPADNFATTVDVKDLKVTLGPQESTTWSRLRAWFGQKRSLVPSPALHGLREIPLEYQMSMVFLIGEFVVGLISLLIGTGYMRGICDAPMQGWGLIINFFYWEVPFQCWRGLSSVLLRLPGDSKWPFHPLVGGHLAFPKGHLSVPKRSQRIARSANLSAFDVFAHPVHWNIWKWMSMTYTYGC